MSSYKQAKNGTWSVQINYKDWQGIRKHTVKRGLRTKAEAKQYKADFLVNHATDCTMSFARLADLYLHDTTSRVRPTTLANREFIIEHHYNPILGNVPINKITPETIRQWQINFLKKGYSETYSRNINNMLAAILNFAVKFFGLKNNPAAMVKKIGQVRNNHMDYWTIEDFNKFIVFLNDKKLNNQHQIKRHIDNYSLTVGFKLLYFSGIRLGELLALTKEDIDWSNNTIHICKTYSQTDNGYTIIHLPTSDKSNRIINLPVTIMNLLQNYISKLPCLDADGRIFHLLNKHNLRRAVKSTSNLAGLKPIRIHDLRHSHASLLINMGYSPRAIADRLGHEKIETTLGIYAHLYNNAGKEIAAKLDELAK